MSICMPRFCVHSVITEPTYSCGMYRLTVTIGSRISSIFDGSGIFDGLSTMSSVPSRMHHLVHHGRRGGDQVHVEFALQPLLHDFHVQQAEEAAAEAEAERLRHFRLVLQRGVVQLQLFQRVAQRVVLVRLDREQAGEHLRLHFLEARQRLGRRLARPGSRYRRPWPPSIP